MLDRPDPLGVLTTTRRVVDAADFVRIDEAAVERVAERMATREIPVAAWNRKLHWSDGRDRMANYLLVLDALNFSFWGEPRWRVEYGGTRYDGYWALAAALKRALEHDVPLDDATYLANMDDDQLRRILAGEGEVPLLPERVRNLREVGTILTERYTGQFARLVEAAEGSAVNVVEIVVANFPSFRDVAQYKGEEVRFYKRAQILVGDLHGAFGGFDLGEFTDLGELTAFADYKVPQVLRQLEVLVYAPALSEQVDRKVEIPAGDPEEVEIRAATIWAVEHLRSALGRRDHLLDAFQIDWALWELGQSLQGKPAPYHRTRTIFY